MNSPANSQHPPSPLNSMGAANSDSVSAISKTGKPVSRTNTTSPMLMMKSKRSMQYNTAKQEKTENNNDDNISMKTPTSNGAPTPTLMSQTQAPSPVQSSHTSQGHSRGASQSFLQRNGPDLINDEKYDGEAHRLDTAPGEVCAKEGNGTTAKQKAEKLFQYDNQQSLLTMANALGITAEDEGRLLDTFSRNNADSKEQNNM